MSLPIQVGTRQVTCDRTRDADTQSNDSDSMSIDEEEAQVSSISNNLSFFITYGHGTRVISRRLRVLSHIPRCVLTGTSYLEDQDSWTKTNLFRLVGDGEDGSGRGRRND